MGLEAIASLTVTTYRTAIRSHVPFRFRVAADGQDFVAIHCDQCRAAAGERVQGQGIQVRVQVFGVTSSLNNPSF